MPRQGWSSLLFSRIFRGARRFRSAWKCSKPRA
jgi:hypothetical protein